MIQKRMIKDWDEQDAFTRWRHYLCYLDKPGIKSWIKRKARRRERRGAKQEIRKEGL